MTASAPEPQPLQKIIAALTGETAVYIFKRLMQGLLTLVLASAVCFIVIQLAPGDYLDALKENPRISKERLDELRTQFRLDKSWIEQYGFWLWGIISRGDFGTSFVYNRSVTSLLLERVPATLILAFSSLIFVWAIGIPLGIISAVKQRSWADKVLRVISYIGQGFPSFITGLLLLIFAQNTSPLFPVGDMTSIDHADLTWLGKIFDIGWHMILPTIALSIVGFAGLQRIARGEMLDVLRQDYIQTARAKGLPENRVIYVHALRNAVNPLITLLGFEFANLLSGAFITEFFFNWPGLGRLTLQAVQAQDLYLLMASLMMGATMLIVGNLIADILLKFVDPRIKLSDMN
ncbi:ABC transporter permease [filamentous cyanobacterium LEGE 11480]|uniref:ABC transporter permease n=1 Tax=Romeriopsis navalis LEGE 11480 TaxID=2777977 RepID=A0A928VP22_9CYAN|nr:ABC transporter permease [Romeriopsis navalis]MBE9031208.1 ABC transporter permease [Romeriopsis navalis LEGE 11480]